VISFCGLIGYYYYKKFFPNFAVLVVPLTDLTKKWSPNQLKWDGSKQLKTEPSGH